MIIHRLKAFGFGMIGDPIELRFPEKGRIAILGENESGKTTLLRAIEYALYGLKRGPTVEEQRENLVTWGKNEARLEMEFTSGQQRFIIQRIIGASSGHRARLAPLIDGLPDLRNAITSVREIEAKIEEITGMDRESFTKLVYVKQKDLDALKDLYKAQREQLINKVMGIEVFDGASGRVKNDRKGLQDELERKRIRLEAVRKNKEGYERMQGQRKELEIAIASLRQDLDERKAELDEAEELLRRYEWLSAYNSANEVLSSLNDQLSQVRKDITEITNLGSQIETWEAALAKYKPRIGELESHKTTFADLERRLGEGRRSAESMEVMVGEAVRKTGLPERNLKLLLTDLPARKQRQLIGFGSMLIAGLAFLITGLLTNISLSLIGIVLLPASLYVFRGYLRLDGLQTVGSEAVSLIRRREEEEKTLEDVKLGIEEQAKQTGFNSTEEVNKALSFTISELISETGRSSVQGLEAVIDSSKERLKRIKDSNPIERAEDLQSQIRTKGGEIENLLRNKPHSVDDLLYNKQLHEAIKEEVDSLQTGCTNVDKDIQNKLGAINQLDGELERLKPDFEFYPQLDQEVGEIQTKAEILGILLNELDETSKELRNKVIPHARFIINRILPALTDGRYSDFEISEDLRFKVHAIQAGGHKEREVFSGGTQDQFLIALRLAFTQSILDSRVMADRYSLLMDECISSSDESRKQGIFEVLDLVRETFPQILVIAHEDISDYVDHHIVLARNQRGYTEIRSRSWSDA